MYDIKLFPDITSPEDGSPIVESIVIVCDPTGTSPITLLTGVSLKDPIKRSLSSYPSNIEILYMSSPPVDG